jgi:hypothetical protein
VTPGDTLISRVVDPSDQFDEPGAIHIGDRGPGQGGGFTVSLGSQFGVPEAEEVYRRLVALESQGAFAEFTCPGDSVPHIQFRITLHREAALQERQADLAYNPEIKPWGADRCLDLGLDYLVARTFAEVDSGPSVSYGYRNPQTGQPLPDEKAGERHARWRPVCHCEQRDSTRDWAVYGPVETTLGAAARP